MWVTDAFQITWRDYQGNAFRSFGPVGKHIQKIHWEESTVAPEWETESWYPLYLLQLLINILCCFQFTQTYWVNHSRESIPKCFDISCSWSPRKSQVSAPCSRTVREVFKVYFCRMEWGTNTTYQLVGKGGIAGKLIPFHMISNIFWIF